MIVRPMEFGMIQQQNTVSQVRHNEDVRPMVDGGSVTERYPHKN